MSVLSDKWIRKMSKEQDMISPFEEKQVRGKSISYGLSSFGYDARVSDEFKIFTNVNSEIVDPRLQECGFRISFRPDLISLDIPLE